MVMTPLIRAVKEMETYLFSFFFLLINDSPKLCVRPLREPPVQFPPDMTPLIIWNEAHNHMDDTLGGRWKHQGQKLCREEKEKAIFYQNMNQYLRNKEVCLRVLTKSLRCRKLP